MADSKDAKPSKQLPEEFTLSEYERAEFERQVSCKRWVDARLEIAQRDFNEVAQTLAKDYEAWAGRVSRRLGIDSAGFARYTYAGGTFKIRPEQAASTEAPAPPSES